MELTLGKSKTDPGSLNKEHCIPLGRTAIPKSFQVEHRPCGDSRYLGIKKHLLDCKADLPSPYRPSDPSTAFSIGNQRDSVKLGGTHNMPPVQELGRVEGRFRSPILVQFQISQGT